MVELEFDNFLKDVKEDYMFTEENKNNYYADAKEVGVEVTYKGDEALGTNKKDFIKYSATMGYECESLKVYETKTIEMKKIK